MYKSIRDNCWSDVQLLFLGMLDFRKYVMDLTKNQKNPYGIDPFQVAITIASLCN